MNNNDHEVRGPNGKYPEALGRKYGEGGYTFLKRVLAKSLENNGPVVMSVDGSYLEYSYKDGDRTFMDGVRLIEGSNQSTLERLKETADAYRLDRGLAEIAAEKEFHGETRRPR